MFAIIKKLLKVLIAMPKDIIVFYRKGNLDFSSMGFFIKHPCAVKKSIENLDTSITRSNGGGWLINFKKIGIKFLVRSIGEFCLINIAFSNNCEYKFNVKGKCIVIDVGANIGDTPLYFANYKNVSHVYAYEPFKEIFIDAQKNIALNPELSKKIDIYNFGLSDADKTLKVKYSSLMNASNSIVDNTDDIIKWDKDRQEVFCADASKIIGEIIRKTDEKIVLKMDCEGSEYEILDSLDKSGLLAKIDAIMLEFHYRGWEPIENVLIKNGFFVFTNVSVGHMGYINAVRNNL